MQFKRIHKNETIVYITLWCVVILICILHISTEHSLNNETWLSLKDILMICKVTGPLFVLFILNNYILIPYLLEHQRVRCYIAGVLMLIGITTLVQYALSPERREHNHRPKFEHPMEPVMHRHMPPPAPLHGLVYSLLVVGLNLGIWSLSRAVAYRIERSQLIAANVESQLNQLKTQINPHFYMNMLNSIHGLVDLNPPKAKDLIMDMSRLMQYMLYDSARDKISLSKEIKFLYDYIKIIKDRYPKGKVAVTSEFPSPETTMAIMVPPLLFIGFVENAFKHGVDYRFESKIDIKISTDAESVVFECKNIVHSKEDKEKRKGGIGLENVKKRLALIYEGKSHLEINEQNNIYYVKLTIPHNETQDINH